VSAYSKLTVVAAPALAVIVPVISAKFGVKTPVVPPVSTAAAVVVQAVVEPPLATTVAVLVIQAVAREAWDTLLHFHPHLPVLVVVPTYIRLKRKLTVVFAGIVMLRASLALPLAVISARVVVALEAESAVSLVISGKYELACWVVAPGAAPGSFTVKLAAVAAVVIVIVLALVEVYKASLALRLEGEPKRTWLLIVSAPNTFWLETFWIWKAVVAACDLKVTGELMVPFSVIAPAP
jgi:hypothetical protein